MLWTVNERIEIFLNIASSITYKIESQYLVIIHTSKLLIKLIFRYDLVFLSQIFERLISESSFICRAKTLKVYSNSRKSSPSRTPVKKQTKVQSLLDPSRLRPPPITSPSSGDLLSPNTRLNIALSMQQDHNNHHDDEILSISIPGESNVV